MAPRDLLATAPSQGQDAPGWYWYAPVVLMVVLTAALFACMYFIKTLSTPLVLVVFGLGGGAGVVREGLSHDGARRVIVIGLGVLLASTVWCMAWMWHRSGPPD